MKLSKILLGSTLSLLLAATASAEPKTADEFYKEGDTQYNLGDFNKAVDAFKQGFALETNDSKKPAYLYNIAQSYRQAQNCQQALFFYKRFLALKATDTVKPLKPQLKAEVEARIGELEDCLKQQDSIRNKPPNDNIRPDGDGHNNTPVKTDPVKTDPVKTNPVKPDVKPDVKPAGKPDMVKPDGNKPDGDKGHGTKRTGEGGDEGGNGEDEGGDDSGIHQVAPTTQAHVVSARLLAGGAKVGMGNITVPVEASVALIAGYPLPIAPQLTLDLGGGFTYTPISYQNASGSGSSTATLMSLAADVGATYAVAPKIGLRGDLGLGYLMFGGLTMGNPFTEGGASTTGALGMFNLRVGVSGEYAVTPNIVVVLTPLAFSYSPAKTGLRSDIKSLTRLDFMVGVGYRM
jgi:hypothetical protein